LVPGATTPSACKCWPRYFSIIIAPIFIWLAGRLEGVATVFDPAELLRVLAVTIGAPLAAGIIIARLWPRAAALSTPLARVSLLLLMAGGAVALVAEASEIASQIGHGVLLVIAAIVLFGLIVGHLLGGPDAGDRGALALATSARHPGLAITLATANFPHDKKAIVAAVLLFLLANLVLTLPYALWRQRRTRMGRKREAPPSDGT
jgi:BASS family bile acid:Na+ symporter